MLATKNVALSVSKALSFAMIPIASQQSEPIQNAGYPILKKPNAIKNAPAMLATVPTQEIRFLFIPEL